MQIINFSPMPIRDVQNIKSMELTNKRKFKLDELKEAIHIGISSGPGNDAIVVLERLKKKYENASKDSV